MKVGDLATCPGYSSLWYRITKIVERRSVVKTVKPLVYIKAIYHSDFTPVDDMPEDYFDAGWIVVWDINTLEAERKRLTNKVNTGYRKLMEEVFVNGT